MVCCGNPDAKFCGHPSGFGIWIPLMFVTAAVVLSAYSMGGCELVTLANGKTFQLSGQVILTASDTSSAQITTQVQDYQANTFGLFSFEVSANGQYGCVGYANSEYFEGFWISAMVFSILRGILGLIVFFWLLLSTCCPIQPVHKTSLITLSLVAFVFSGLSFLFYGNPICQEYGCVLTTGAWYQISGAILYLGTAMVLMGIKAKEPSWLLEQQQQNQNRDEHSTIEQKPTFESAEEGLPPAAVTGVVLDAK
mmetsp:Transcript_25165/g.36054  ORF Transcript_25165/g.36054 Transcript_25165/m.36054 type:complete len:252 (-) Transcript_25165:161-916(-)